MEKFLSIFTDETDTHPSSLRITRTLLVVVIAATLALLPLLSGITDPASRDLVALMFLSVGLVVEIVSLYLVQQGKPLMAKFVTPLMLLLTIIFTASSDNGLRDLSMIGLPLVLIISALLLGKRSMWVVTPLTIIAVIIIAVSDIRNDRPIEQAGWTQAAIIMVLLLLCSAVIQIMINRLNESIKEARDSEQKQILENRELNMLRRSLEDRIAQRTSQLERSNKIYERRVRQFEAVAQVTRVITAIQDLDTLLPYITQVISEQFEIYHTGIFLIDKQGEYAVLRAANSEGGRRMLQRGHKLRVGQTGIIGFVTATGQPRIALDVGADAVYFNNPDLPNTRSEIGLPLRYAGQIIGALDVQSAEPNAFIQEDIETLLTLADQVSASINSATMLMEMQNKLKEYQKSVEESTRETWKVMRPPSLGIGIELKNAEIQPLQQPLEEEPAREAVEKNKIVLSAEEGAPSILAVPIRLRNQVIGVIRMRGNQHKFTNDDADIVEAISERLSFALETATLLQATRRRAEIERVTTDISSRISSSTQFETILQTAARELSRALGGSDVLVQIEPVSFDLGMKN